MITAPPHSMLAATIGLRFLDSKLVLGERTRAASASEGVGTTTAETTVPGYVVEDLFATYQMTKRVQFFGSAENIGNRQYYSDALATVASPGTTAKFGITVALGG